MTTKKKGKIVTGIVVGKAENVLTIIEETIVTATITETEIGLVIDEEAGLGGEAEKDRTNLEITVVVTRGDQEDLDPEIGITEKADRDTRMIIKPSCVITAITGKRKRRVRNV